MPRDRTPRTGSAPRRERDDAGKSSAPRPARPRQGPRPSRPHGPRPSRPQHGPRPSRPQPGPRRALSNLGGEVERVGDLEVAEQLATALQAPAGDSAALTHGFHTYPARMHPAIARSLIASLSAPGARVLDPFCGSGTVAIEAMVAGRRAVGVDLNPLAVRIAAVQSELRGEAARTRFEHTLEAVTAASIERVRGRVPVRAKLTPKERSFYDPHVLLELAGLYEEIARVENAADRRALEIVFSSLLVKFSRQQADTVEEHVIKRIRKGLTSEFFLRKGHELSQRWAALCEAAGRDAVPARVLEGDARALPAVLRDAGAPRDLAFDLVLTSPPYGGTYDYHAHHARRYPWLQIDAGALARHEVGARRRLTNAPDAIGQWDRELGAALRAMSAVCRPGARVVLLLGDAQVGGQRVDAREQVAKLARDAKLTRVAAAAQQRRDFAGGPPKREHLLLLERTS